MLNGSFVTAKFLPGDYDAIWDFDTVDVSLIDPVFLDFSGGRFAMKNKYLGDLFPSQVNGMPEDAVVEFFQTNRNEVEKGLVRIYLRRM